MQTLRIDAAFPGGNILVEQIEGDTVSLRQDQRDTDQPWFYWCFRIRGAAGRRLTFRFTDWNVLGVHGPAVSHDGGWNWHYLGAACMHESSFRYTFGAMEDDVYFGFTIPYTHRHLDRWLDARQGRGTVVREPLCTSNGGRAVDRLLTGCLDGTEQHRLFMAARHHCCESIASYVIEGFLDAVQAETADGAWWRRQVAVAVVPFVDADGVEQGDQGKCRRPRDHGRDYLGESLYTETAAIRRWLPEWAGDRLRVVLDMHCPWIRGEYNEHIYFVGQEDPELWRETHVLAAALEDAITGPLPYHAAGNLPFGTAWNTSGNYADGRGMRRWAEELPGRFLAASIETPYANVEGALVTTAGARAFGHDLAAGLKTYLQG